MKVEHGRLSTGRGLPKEHERGWEEDVFSGHSTPERLDSLFELRQLQGAARGAFMEHARGAEQTVWGQNQISPERAGTREESVDTKPPTRPHKPYFIHSTPKRRSQPFPSKLAASRKQQRMIS